MLYSETCRSGCLLLVPKDWRSFRLTALVEWRPFRAIGEYNRDAREVVRARSLLAHSRRAHFRRWSCRHRRVPLASVAARDHDWSSMRRLVDNDEMAADCGALQESLAESSRLESLLRDQVPTRRRKLRQYEQLRLGTRRPLEGDKRPRLQTPSVERRHLSERHRANADDTGRAVDRQDDAPLPRLSVHVRNHRRQSCPSFWLWRHAESWHGQWRVFSELSGAQRRRGRIHCAGDLPGKDFNNLNIYLNICQLIPLLELVRQRPYIVRRSALCWTRSRRQGLLCRRFWWTSSFREAN